jgi:hypothetical protein
MAPLPVFHNRQLSMDSRETSVSGGSSGRAVDSSADSASGFSLPMRGAANSAVGTAGDHCSVPDSPTTLNGTLATSSDFLVPTEARCAPVAAAAESTVRAACRNGHPLELETSFTNTRSPRRSGAYTGLPTSEQQVRQMGGAGSNRSYGLSGPRGMAESRSTQPLLGGGASLESPGTPTVIGSEAGQGLLPPPPTGYSDAGPDGFPMGPLPPTPTDGLPSPVGLDVASLRTRQNQLPTPLGQYSRSTAAAAQQQQARKEPPSSEISV